MIKVNWFQKKTASNIMDPYEILGVSYNSSWKDIRKSYKHMLIQTHPDKMGNDKFFGIVQDAYRSIKKQYELHSKESNYPKEQRDYNSQSKTKLNPNTDRFNLNQFNEMFDEYSKLYNQSDPYLNGGYKTCDRLNHQEDIQELNNKKVNIPKRELVIFKEPEALVSSSLMESVCHLGINKINDYTCRNGSDYMRAYSEEAELIDNRQEYKNLDHIKEIRSQQSFQLTDDDRKQQRKNERKQQKLEQMRQTQMNSNDQEYSRIHSYVQNRLI